MKTKGQRILSHIAASICLTSALLLSPSVVAKDISVNGQTLPQNTVNALEMQYQTQIQSGDYWYDSFSGLWGYECGPASGVLAAGLRLGGRLKATASCGNTNVFINGRQIHYNDLMYLQQLVGAIQPGRYWLDAQGNAGLEGGPMLVNLYQSQRSGGGDGVHRHRDSNSSGIFSDGCSGITVKGANGSSSSAYVGC